MDLTELNTLKSLLSRLHVRPADKLGQNFLVDRVALDKIVAAAALEPSNLVVEIGAGFGTLTEALCKGSGQVVAIEKDRRLIKPLRFVLKKFQNVEIVDGDFLKLDISSLLTTHYPLFTSFKVVANIPYYLTGRILENLLVLKKKPELIVLLVQKEVGERVCAAPGEMSVLAVAVQAYSRPEMVSLVTRESFFPSPEVDSVILKLVPYQNFVVEADEKSFFRLVKVGFSHRRKTLENNLAAGLHLPKTLAAALVKSAGLSPTVRPQELSLADWARLLRVWERGRSA
ncbi:MAG: 16S rRNA (adenine(1518)-N(6)/adenine(1519)-N(6))-dimethyltransferase RsmA [Patescibacteria group bacterium]|nr:16S rRNA (adenine(1518)-N(6)/adenine(1519)-N(6))-dimethyltransferase RsmA [Patescibacteria group bacterium]